MKSIFLFIYVYAIAMVLYLVTVIYNKKKLATFPKSNQALIITKRYNLKITKKNVKEFALKIALTNSFILAISITVADLVKNFLLKLLVAFLVMTPLIFILYHLIGRSMKKEGK